MLSKKRFLHTYNIQIEDNGILDFVVNNHKLGVYSKDDFKNMYNIIKNKDWDKVKEVADRAMKSVEDYARAHPGELSSEQKLDMALQAIENALVAENIKFSAKMTKRTIAYIKDCVAWFNGMNGR